MPTLNRSTHFKLPTGVLGASLSSDGLQLATACMDGVYLCDLVSKSSERIDQHLSYASSVSFLSDNSLVSAGYDGRLQWYAVSEKSRTRQLTLHDFWSWDMATSPDGRLIASVTGQYLAGGYKYEPQPEREPSVRLVDAATGDILHSLPHVPSVQSVAFSPDGNHIAAGNLMGEVRVWEVATGKLAATISTSAFTSWGIIKSHCYLGGVFALSFTPDGSELLLAGMGPMRDPMAGNGKQLWQKWAWREQSPKLIDQTHDGEAGEGLMETLAIHPDGRHFVMGGRLRGGDWNLAMFELASGKRVATLKTGYRITEALFSHDGQQLILVGSQGQPGPNDKGEIQPFGRLEVYDIS